MKKGQIFTLDVFLALLAVTVILGYMAWQLEEVYSQSYGVEFTKVQSMSNDWSQIAAKNLLAKGDKPNDINLAKLDDLETEMDEVIVFPYYYEVLMLGSGVLINQGACDGKSNIAVSRRLVIVNKVLDELVVKVCV